MACFHGVGNFPLKSDDESSAVKNGANVTMVSLSNHVGRGSDGHFLLGDALTHTMTSGIIGTSNTDNEDPLYLWYSAGPALDVLLLTPLTLSL